MEELDARQFLTDAGRVLWTRDRLAALGAQMAADTRLQGDAAREVSTMVTSGALDRAERAAARVVGGGL